MRRMLALALLAVCGTASARQPNVIIILADDLGYGELSCYGQKLYATPRIDRMASEGMRFTDFYSGSPVCASSRCTLITGLHTGHARIRSNGTTSGRPVMLLPEDITLAEVLRGAGYATACIGKWGMGEAGSPGVPNLQGFDYFYGFLNQTAAHFHFPRTLWRNQEEITIPGNDPDAQTGTPAQTLFTEEALKYIREQREKPFFLYLTFTYVHAELSAPADEIASTAGECFEPETPFKKDHYGAQAKPRAAFAAMAHMLDTDVGRVLDLLDELKLSQDTLVLFTSDNGPHKEGGHDPDYFHSSGPLRGIKRDLYDGGIRVPMIARWPGVVPAGSTSSYIGGFWDLLPTAAEVADAKAPEGLDGLSFLPALRGDAQHQRQHEFLYWEFFELGGRQAVRAGEWKGVRMNVLKNPDAPLELYNLTSDIGEQHDVAAQHPEVAKRLRDLMHNARTPSDDFVLPNP